MGESSALQTIKDFIIQKNLDYSYITLAQFISQTLPQVNETSLWLCILVQHEVQNGNVCIKLDEIQKKSIVLGWTKINDSQSLLEIINDSPVVGFSDTTEPTPLIYDQQRLYLNRFYHNEKNVAHSLLTRKYLTQTLTPQTIQFIESIFSETGAVDFQKLALINSLRHSVSIISGGPGTGKTWVVGKILQALIQLNHQNSINIRLAAPTGKAAARLSQSILSMRENMKLDERLIDNLPEQAVTIHRLLGLHRFAHRPKFDKNHLLDCDVLVLDEASMIDQQMMAMVCDALPEQCKLILLGDKDQLSSVEAGSVFADLCGGLTQTSFTTQQQSWLKQNFDIDLDNNESEFGLADQIVVLQQSRRFDDASTIGLLASKVNQGNPDQSMELLKTEDLFAGVYWQSVTAQNLISQIRQQSHQIYSAMIKADSVPEAFNLFKRYQILCAVWDGYHGVDNINQALETLLKTDNRINSDQEFYKGKPIIMTSNSYQYDIHNGDIGIIFPDDQQQLRVWFEDNKNGYRALSLSLCPPHKTAYAITVHKSQGSEFNHVLMILPETITPVSSRELLYTGITRAIDSVEIWGREEIIKSMIKQKTERVSGLMQRLNIVN